MHCGGNQALWGMITKQRSHPCARPAFPASQSGADRGLSQSGYCLQVTVSFGNVASQISLPCFMSHASIPADVRAARGLPDDLVRISCGIEDADDLISGAHIIINHRTRFE